MVSLIAGPTGFPSKCRLSARKWPVAMRPSFHLIDNADASVLFVLSTDCSDAKRRGGGRYWSFVIIRAVKNLSVEHIPPFWGIKRGDLAPSMRGVAAFSDPTLFFSVAPGNKQTPLLFDSESETHLIRPPLWLRHLTSLLQIPQASLSLHVIITHDAGCLKDDNN